MTSNEAETLRRHNFGNVGSLLKIEINRSLIEDLMARWTQFIKFFNLEQLNFA